MSGDRLISDSVRRHYNYAQHLPERRMMMQAWADYLDGLRSEQTSDRTERPVVLGLHARLN